MKRAVLFAAMLAAFAAPSAAPASAQSFKCSQATTAVENMICGEEALAILDEDMSWAYGEAKTRVDVTAIGQLAWLRNVRDRCTTVECLRVAYVSRVIFLQKLGNTVLPATFPLDGLAGTWKRLKNTRDVYTNLKIDTVVADGFRFEMFGINGDNHGEITGVAVRRTKDALYQSQDTDKCQLTFTRQKTHLLVVASPDCVGVGGFGVALDGEFER
jgi:uncharacterized protein